MAMKESVAEILKRVSEIKSRKEQIETLRKDHNSTLEAVVDICFNPKHQFVLPEGDPPYKAQPKESDLQTSLYANVRKFRIFLKDGPYQNMKSIQRESQFVQFLESLDPDDAKLVLSIKDKKMPYKGITRKLFEEAWPALASTWKPEEKNG